MNETIIVAASLYGNPLTTAHIDYLKASKELGDELWVIVNNDEQVKLKQSIPFMDQFSRFKIIDNLKFVDKTIIAIDDNGSVAKTLAWLKPNIFTNGGPEYDNEKSNSNEFLVCRSLGIKMIFGVGGYEKTESSSRLIEKSAKKWIENNEEKTIEIWNYLHPNRLIKT